MYYIEYLGGICQRRSWPEPIYECRRSRGGYICTVRVNNREYSSDSIEPTPELAENAAACQAYMICRVFSAADGRLPQHHRNTPSAAAQGNVVAIGTGRPAHPGQQPQRYHYDDPGSRRSSSGSSSGANACSCGQPFYGQYSQCYRCLLRGQQRY